MNVPTHNIQGLLIYRELCEKEGRSVGRWRERFGAEALLKDMEPEKMANLAVFDAAFSAPLPLDAQLKMMKQKNAELKVRPSPTPRKSSAQFSVRRAAPLSAAPLTPSSARLKAKVTKFEADNFPHLSPYKVSQASVGLYGEKAWHTQPKQAEGAPAINPPPIPPPDFSKRAWTVDHQYYNHEEMQPHQTSAARTKMGLPPFATDPDAPLPPAGDPSKSDYPLAGYTMEELAARSGM